MQIGENVDVGSVSMTSVSSTTTTSGDTSVRQRGVSITFVDRAVSPRLINVTNASGSWETTTLM